MARMIPNQLDDDHGSFGERQVFDALKSGLPDDYTVFHSVRWNNYNEKKTVIWGECDFTIFHPEYGLLIVEVKSGGIECSEGKWNYIRTDNNEKYSMKRGPLEQADREIRYQFKDYVSEIIEGQRCLEPEYCLVEPAVWFPSINRRDLVGALPMEYREEIVLFENALQDPRKAIDSVYKFYGGRSHTRLRPTTADVIINGFAPLFRAVPSLKSKRDEKNAEFVRLTREQNYLLDYLDEQKVAAIQGSAGTGKTMLAVEKAKRLMKSGKVLFLCFNRYLKEYLQQLKTENTDEYQGVDFYNLPQLACGAMSVTSVEQSDVIYYLKNYENYNWEYSHIVIDEGQDFSDEEICCLHDIALLQEGSFYIFYDRKQFVQGREFPKWLADAECRLVLNINCRNTYQIANTSGRPVDLQPKVRERSVEGDMPSFYGCKDPKMAQKAISRLIDQYRMAGYPYREICLLTLGTEENSILNGIKKIGNHTVCTERNDKGVLFTTARKFKGLESDAIIIVDIDEETFYTEESKRLFYVGSSRAKHNLDLIFVGTDEDLQELIRNISDQPFPNSRIGIARSLNVKPVIEG